MLHSCIYRAAASSISPPVRPPAYPYTHLHTHPSTHPLTHTYTHLHTHPYIHLHAHPSIHLLHPPCRLPTVRAWKWEGLFLCIWMSWNSLNRPGLPQTPPSWAFSKLGLKVCAAAMPQELETSTSTPELKQTAVRLTEQTAHAHVRPEPPVTRGRPRRTGLSGRSGERAVDIPGFGAAPSFLLRPPSQSSSHGPALPHGRGPQQGPQGDEEREQAEAQPAPRAPHQAHQVRAGHDPGGVRLRTLRAARHGAAQGVQGQARAQVHQEEGGHAHPRQEEARGAEQRAGGHEEGGGQEGLSPRSPSPSPIKAVTAEVVCVSVCVRAVTRARSESLLYS